MVTGRILLVIGVVALFAAIVGGGIKFKDIEVGSVKSLWRQGLLGLFGLAVSVVGGVMMIAEGSSTTADAPNTQAAEQNGSAAANEAGNDVNAVEENAANAAAADANAPATTDSNTTTE